MSSPVSAVLAQGYVDLHDEGPASKQSRPHSRFQGPFSYTVPPATPASEDRLHMPWYGAHVLSSGRRRCSHIGQNGS